MSRLSELIETMTRPALLGLAGKVIEKRARKELTSYFRALKPEIQALNLGQMAVAGTSVEIGRHAAMMRVSRIVRMHQDVLKGILATNMTAAMLIADKTHPFAEALDPNEVPLDTVDTSQPTVTAELAAAWADQNAAQAVIGIDQTTIDKIADAVATGIEEELGVQGTADLISALLDTMSEDRAFMIARTEMNAAFSQAALDKLEGLGILWKQWILGPNPCEICEENADASPIPFGQMFPSGDEAPPAHPNCACAVTGSRPPATEQ